MTKFNKSEIMRNAWRRYRDAENEKSFAECLHDAWVYAKMLSIGRLWEKYGKRRIYFDNNDLLALCGVKFDFYKSGNICSCQVNGEYTSNANGSRWAESVNGMYYDLDTKKFRGNIGRFADTVRATVRAYLGC